MHEELKQVISQSMNESFEFERKLIERTWEDEAFKQELISNPKAVYERESGQELPKALEIEVLQETANKHYLVLPTNILSDTTSEEELTEEALEAVAGGICVGFTLISKTVKKWGITVKNANNLVEP